MEWEKDVLVRCEMVGRDGEVDMEIEGKLGVAVSMAGGVWQQH